MSYPDLKHHPHDIDEGKTGLHVDRREPFTSEIKMAPVVDEEVHDFHVGEVVMLEGHFGLLFAGIFGFGANLSPS